MSKVDEYKARAAQLVRNPDDVDALVSQFSVLSENRENGKHYLVLARRAYELAPDKINVAMNYASALHRAGEFEKSLAIYKKCAESGDEFWKPLAIHHVGIAYRALSENKKAIAAYDEAIALTGRLDIMKDRALAMMADRRLVDGLKAFEVRKEIAAERLRKNNNTPLVTQQRLPDNVSHWEGEDLKGKHIVVYHEEGSGDFIQFCRFIPKLRGLGASKVSITGPVPDLLDLVSDNIKVDGVLPLDQFECDYVIGSMSLPWRLGVEYKDVSGRPYFRADPANIPLRGKLNVGLVWRGNPQYGMDVHRSMAFSEFCPLFDLPGVAFYSLQAGAPGLEVTNLGFDGFVANLEPFAKNWRATAGLISALDVVVSVDTACAHLAGALGKPVFIMITNASDWRWNRFSQKTDWYDSARVIRQRKQDEWGPVIKTVRDQLKDMALERRRAA